MFVSFSMYQRYKKDIWAGAYKCPHCGAISDHYLYRQQDCGKIYGILFFVMTKKYGLACNHCNAFIPISCADYKLAQKEQNLKLKQHAFPMEIMRQDYNPNALNMSKRRTLLIISAVICFLFFLTCLMMVHDLLPSEDLSVPIQILIFFLIGSLPLIFTLISYISAKNKLSLYNTLHIWARPAAELAARGNGASHSVHPAIVNRYTENLEYAQAYSTEYSSKSKTIAIILSIVFPTIGAHFFYLGKPIPGILCLALSLFSISIGIIPIGMMVVLSGLIYAYLIHIGKIRDGEGKYIISKKQAELYRQALPGMRKNYTQLFSENSQSDNSIDPRDPSGL
ncbi:MAG: NINE protein [Ruminococcaceae bacterium]|nr:NINE protein [Oscillospiraceae bacterium]